MVRPSRGRNGNGNFSVTRIFILCQAWRHVPSLFASLKLLPHPLPLSLSLSLPPSAKPPAAVIVFTTCCPHCELRFAHSECAPPDPAPYYPSPLSWLVTSGTHTHTHTHATPTNTTYHYYLLLIGIFFSLYSMVAFALLSALLFDIYQVFYTFYS